VRWSSSSKSQQERVAQPRHPTKHDSIQDVLHGASGHEYVVHGEGKYADGGVHVNTCESHVSLARYVALAPSRY